MEMTACRVSGELPRMPEPLRHRLSAHPGRGKRYREAFPKHMTLPWSRKERRSGGSYWFSAVATKEFPWCPALGLRPTGVTKLDTKRRIVQFWFRTGFRPPSRRRKHRDFRRHTDDGTPSGRRPRTPPFPYTPLVVPHESCSGICVLLMARGIMPRCFRLWRGTLSTRLDAGRRCSPAAASGGRTASSLSKSSCHASRSSSITDILARLCVA